MTKGLRFAFIGSGQGGNNAVNEMAAHDKSHVYAILNIAGVDMDECSNIPAEHKLKVGTQEGAGQNIKVGRQVIINEKGRAKKWVSAVVDQTDMPYLVGSSGGGFGTIATPTLSAVMAEEMQLPHSVIYIIPRHNEDLLRQKNARAGLVYLRELANKSLNLKGVMLISNEELIKHAKTIPGTDGLWTKANRAIADRLQCAYKYTLRPSTMAIDPMDYKKVVFRRGAYTVLETVVSISDATTENVFAHKFRELLDGDYSNDFIITGDLRKAEAVAVFIEREDAFPVEGDAIEKLKEVIRDETTAILRPVGVYRPHDEDEKKSFLSSAVGLFKQRPDKTGKVVKMTVVFAGMPFPDKVIDDLELRITAEEIALMESKSTAPAKEYKITTEEIGFLDEVNLVSGVTEKHNLLESPVLGDAFSFADDSELDGLTLNPKPMAKSIA